MSTSLWRQKVPEKWYGGESKPGAQGSRRFPSLAEVTDECLDQLNARTEGVNTLSGFDLLTTRDPRHADPRDKTVWRNALRPRSLTRRHFIAWRLFVDISMMLAIHFIPSSIKSGCQLEL